MQIGRKVMTLLGIAVIGFLVLGVAGALIGPDPADDQGQNAVTPPAEPSKIRPGRIVAEQLADSRQTLPDDAYGCLTQQDLDRLVAAAWSDDLATLQQLLSGPCMAIGGAEYHLLQQGPRVSTVRIYSPAIRDLYVPSDIVSG